MRRFSPACGLRCPSPSNSAACWQSRPFAAPLHQPCPSPVYLCSCLHLSAQVATLESHFGIALDIAQTDSVFLCCSQTCIQRSGTAGSPSIYWDYRPPSCQAWLQLERACSRTAVVLTCSCLQSFEVSPLASRLTPLPCYNLCKICPNRCRRVANGRPPRRV